MEQADDRIDELPAHRYENVIFRRSRVAKLARHQTATRRPGVPARFARGTEPFADTMRRRSLSR